MRQLPRPLLLLALGCALNSLGLAFLWPLTAIYVHQVLHQPMPVVGVILTLQAAAGLVGSLWGGMLYDRRGPRTPLLGAIGVATVLLLAVALHGTLIVYGVAVCLVGLSVGVAYPILNALAAHLWPAGGRQAFNAIYVAQNAGVAVGSVLGGLVASIGFRLTFLTAAVLLLGFFLLILFGYRGPAWTRERRRPTPPSSGRAPTSWLLVGWPVLLLALGMMMDSSAYVQWSATLPSYMTGEGIPLPLYSVLWSINGALILAGQPMVAWVSRRFPALKSQILIGNTFFLLGFILLVIARAYPAYVAAMALCTTGEMLVWPGVPAAANAYADEARRGTVQGLVSMAGSAGRMVGPLLGGFLFSLVSRPELFLIMAAIFLLAGVVYWLYDGVPGTRASRPAIGRSL
ncbi:MAG: MFS transporter [Clostridia bacterium]